MANIDTSTIDGFDTMSTEDKLNALLGLEIPEAVDLTKYVTKEVFDKKANEAATLSKQLKSKMSEDELAAAEAARVQKENDDRYTDLEAKYNDLVKQSTINTYTAKYLAQGYDEKLAKATAVALVDGDMDTVFKNGETFKAELEKKIKSDQMKNDPHPGGGAGGKDDNSDSAVEKAKELAKTQKGTSKYDDVMKNYK